MPNPLGDDIDVTVCNEPTAVCQAPNYQANASASTAVTVTIAMGDEVVFQETVPVEVSSEA